MAFQALCYAPFWFAASAASGLPPLATRRLDTRYWSGAPVSQFGFLPRPDHVLSEAGSRYFTAGAFCFLPSPLRFEPGISLPILVAASEPSIDIRCFLGALPDSVFCAVADRAPTCFPREPDLFAGEISLAAVESIFNIESAPFRPWYSTRSTLRDASTASSRPSAPSSSVTWSCQSCKTLRA
jgi:hypothetical protein